MKRTLFILARNLSFVFVLGFLPSLFLTRLGYDSLLVCLFSISILTIWTDGLLTMFAINKGATEVNPLIIFVNKTIGKKWGILLSRVIGSLFPIVGLLIGNVYLILVIAWLFSAAVCLNSATLASRFNKDVNSKDADASND